MCGCGGAEAVNRPESADLMAVIHPTQARLGQEQKTDMESLLVRRDSASSTSSTASNWSAASSSSVSVTSFRGGRLRFSNRSVASSSTTRSEFYVGERDGEIEQTDIAVPSSVLKGLQICIHRFGFPSDIESMPNPVVHRFPLSNNIQKTVAHDRIIGNSDVQLDLGLGGEGVLGRTVTICNTDGSVFGEGVIGRI